MYQEPVDPSLPVPAAPPVGAQAAGQPPSPGAPTGTTICSFCGTAVPANSIYCPACGKQLMDKQLSTTVFSQIWIYSVSVFLPPLGFWPGMKYFKSFDPKAQRMGMIAIVLTVLSTIVTIWLTFYFVQSYLNDINSALNGTGITPTQATGGLL